MQPKTRYARNGEVNIAYQVVGDGPRDLVFVPGYISHLDLFWSFPEGASFARRLASFSRLIMFDKRGTGLSDPAPGVPTLEERMEDLHAVLDTAGSERTSLFGISEGGPMSLLFAATYPERVESLVIYGSVARFSPRPEDSPEDQENARRAFDNLATIIDDWGEGASIDLFAPSRTNDTALRQAFALYERASASPTMARALIESLLQIDVTSVLPAISVPTLVAHRTGDQVIPASGSLFMAERIPGAKLVEQEGDDHSPWFGRTGALLDEVEHFITGSRHSHEPDRILASVMFTDIVSSTERAGEMGDRTWAEVLRRHDADARRQVEAHGGRLVKGTGDGHLATFDGPARAIRCALALTEDARALGIEIRAGVHTGECEVLDDDIGGMAVHIAARVMARAGDGEVCVSSAVRDLVVGSGLEFADRGTHQLKGVPGEWTILAVDDGATTLPASAHARRSRDHLAPNQDVRKRGDKLALGIARRTPALARFASRVASRGRERAS